MVEKSNFPLGCSHRNPAPIGTRIKTVIERGDAYSAPVYYNIEIAVLQVVRGLEAMRNFETKSEFDLLPMIDSEYIFIRIELRYSSRGKGFLNEEYTLTKEQFVTVSSDGNTENEIPLNVPQLQPQLIDCTLNPGESREGWITLQVPKIEKKPLMVFKHISHQVVFGIKGCLWFKLF